MRKRASQIEPYALADQPRPETVAAALAAAQTELSNALQTIAELRAALDAARLRERTLTNDLQHRVRNMLAVIRSIYRRSREHGASPDEFAEHFEGRLNSVARHQSAVIGPDAANIDLEDIVRNELLDVRGLDEPRLTITGPSVLLPEKAAELMGLAIHELTTNAVKFGALYDQGTLNIAWSVSDLPDQRLLHFHWREEGVRVLASAPRAKGFGQQFIEEAMPYQLGATTSFELRPGGLACSILLPIPLPSAASEQNPDPIDDMLLVQNDPE